VEVVHHDLDERDAVDVEEEGVVADGGRMRSSRVKSFQSVLRGSSPVRG
jgi:hypothetical protein